jgi:hypothetical protein
LENQKQKMQQDYTKLQEKLAGQLRELILQFNKDHDVICSDINYTIEENNTWGYTEMKPLERIEAQFICDVVKDGPFNGDFIKRSESEPIVRRWSQKNHENVEEMSF